MINYYKNALDHGINIVKKGEKSGEIYIDEEKEIFLIDCLKYYIFNITNINDYFFSEQETLEYIDEKLAYMLYKLKDSENIFEDSISVLKEIIEKSKFIENSTKFYAFTNINKFEDELDDSFNKILNFFDLNYHLKYGGLSYDDKKYYQLILSTEYNSYSPILNIDDVKDIFYSFLGFCSYILKKHTRTVMIRNANKLDITYNIVDFNIYHIIPDNNFENLIENNEKMIQKPKEGMGFDIKNMGECLRKNDNYSQLFSKNDEINDFFKEVFKVYHESCIQTELKYSFLSFWSLSEHIIKTIWNEDVKDDKLVKIFQNIFKRTINNDYTPYLISLIKEKRNKLVHENKNEILLADQGIVKILTDIIIELLIINIEKVNSIQDYKNIISSLNNNK